MQRRKVWTRGECLDEPRPCGRILCRYILPFGKCALDFADEGSATMGEIAARLGITDTGADMVLRRAIAKMREGLGVEDD